MHIPLVSLWHQVWPTLDCFHFRERKIHTEADFYCKFSKAVIFASAEVIWWILELKKNSNFPNIELLMRKWSSGGKSHSSFLVKYLGLQGVLAEKCLSEDMISYASQAQEQNCKNSENVSNTETKTAHSVQKVTQREWLDLCELNPRHNHLNLTSILVPEVRFSCQRDIKINLLIVRDDIVNNFTQERVITVWKNLHLSEKIIDILKLELGARKMLLT